MLAHFLLRNMVLSKRVCWCCRKANEFVDNYNEANETALC